MSDIPKQRIRSTAPQLAPSVLFQFVLSEFLELDQITSNIHHIIQIPEDLGSWKNHLQILIGSSHPSLHTWEEDQGKILKLKNLCTHLVEVLQSRDVHIKKLPHATQQLLNVAIKCFHSSPSYQLSHWSRLNKSLTDYKTLISKAVNLFSKDENVLLFLLKNHQQIDQVFGKAFVFQTFQKHLSSNKTEIQEFLIDRYQQRGFQKLESLIRSKIEELNFHECC